MALDPTAEGGRLGPILAAHHAGAIALPEEVIAAVTRAGDLSRRAIAAEEAARVEKGESDAAEDRAISALLKDATITDPSQSVRDAVAKAKALKQDAELLHWAHERAVNAILPRFMAAAADIARQLTVGLVRVLTEARPHAPLLVGFNYADPDAVHEAPKDVRDAYHAIDRQTRVNDAIRQAAMALYLELSMGKGHDFGKSRREVLTALDDAAFSGEARESHDGAWIGQFCGSGLVGPAPLLRGTGSPDWSHAWRWAPGDADPVERLAADALAFVPADEAVAPEVVAVEEPSPPKKTKAFVRGVGVVRPIGGARR